MSKLVLIADDNIDNILLLKRILKRAGIDIEFIEAQTGRETLELARDTQHVYEAPGQPT